MKYPLIPALLPLFCAGLLAATPAFPAPPLRFTWVDADDPAVADLRKLGEQTIQQTGSAMLTEVGRVLATRGAAKGITELHLKDLKLPVAQPGKPQITVIRRTSLRVRNPANLPDNADLAALMSIKTELMDGNSPPKVLMQLVEASGDAPAEWRVYRPISVASQCLVCHGPAGTLAPGVQAALALNYPEDKAVDYAVADWRGVIRVSLVPPAPSPLSVKKTNP